MVQIIKRAENEEMKKRFIFGVKNSPTKRKWVKPFVTTVMTLIVLGASVCQKRNVAVMSSNQANVVNVIDNIRGAEQVIKDINAWLKINPDINIDISSMIFSKNDLELVKGLECQKSKDIMKSATKIRTDKGYCARHSKFVMLRNGLFDHLPTERKEEIMWGLGSAYQFIDCFNSGEVKDFVELNLDKDAAEQTTMPFPVCRVNETAEGAEDAHIQFMDKTGGYYGQMYPSSPTGHKDENGVFHEYGAPHFYAHKDDVRTLVSEVEGLVGIMNPKNNTIEVFRENEVPQRYQSLMDEYTKNALELFDDTVKVDAVRINKPELHPSLLDKLNKDIKTSVLLAHNTKERP